MKTELVEKTRKEINRDVILRCAVELFHERGVDDTSVNLIVARAGIAKGTFYLYFRSKDELIEEVFDGFTSDFFEKVVSPNSLEPRVAAFSEGIIGFFAANTLFLEELRKSLFSNKRFRYAEKAFDALSGVIGNYINLKESYPISQLDAYSRIIISSILEICYRLLVDRSIKDQKEARIMLEDLLKRFFDCGHFFT